MLYLPTYFSVSFGTHLTGMPECAGDREKQFRPVLPFTPHKRQGFLSAIPEKWFRGFIVPEHNSHLIREPIEPIASTGHAFRYGEVRLAGCSTTKSPASRSKSTQPTIEGNGS